MGCAQPKPSNHQESELIESTFFDNKSMDEVRGYISDVRKWYSLYVLACKGHGETCALETSIETVCKRGSTFSCSYITDKNTEGQDPVQKTTNTTLVVEMFQEFMVKIAVYENERNSETFTFTLCKCKEGVQVTLSYISSSVKTTVLGLPKKTTISGPQIQINELTILTFMSRFNSGLSLSSEPVLSTRTDDIQLVQ